MTEVSAPECPCGRGLGLADCCGPVIDDTRPAATAEALVRSRYTAFPLGDGDHLRRSWAPETCPTRIRLDPARRWTGLEVLSVVDGRELATTGVVEFRAHYVVDGIPRTLHERSRFRRERGRWVYVDGTVGPST